MLGDMQRHRVFFGLATLVLFLSFAFNFFGAVSTAAFVQNFKDSEALVVNQIRCESRYFSSQMLELKDLSKGNTQPTCEPAALKPYSSQFGLQARVYAYGYRVLDKVSGIPVNAYVVTVQLLTALASALCLGLVALWVRSQFGRGVAGVVVVLLALSPMLVGFGRNLYWALPLMILPFIAALYYYRPVAKLKYQVYFWLVIGLLLYIRYLCGYEYLTTLTIMVAAAIGYHLALSRASRKVYVQQFAIVLAVSVMGFALALTTHIVSLTAYAGSASNAASIIKKRALERTTHSDQYLAYPIMGLRSNLPDQYSILNSYLDFDGHAEHPSQLWASLASLLNYAFMPVYVMPVLIAQPLAGYAQSVLVFAAILAWLYVGRRKWVVKAQLHQVEGLFVGTAIGIIGFLSWLVLARSHSLVHAHINGILLYLPFALFGYCIIGLYVVSVAAKLHKRYRK